MDINAPVLRNHIMKAHTSSKCLECSGYVKRTKVWTHIKPLWSPKHGTNTGEASDTAEFRTKGRGKNVSESLLLTRLSARNIDHTWTAQHSEENELVSVWTLSLFGRSRGSKNRLLSSWVMYSFTLTSPESARSKSVCAVEPAHDTWKQCIS